MNDRTTDQLEQYNRWREFMLAAGDVGKTAYIEAGMTPKDLGSGIFANRHTGQPAANANYARAIFAYRLSLHEREVRDRLVLAITAFQLERSTLFEFFISSEFGISEQELGKTYIRLKTLFDNWVETFRPIYST